MDFSVFKRKGLFSKNNINLTNLISIDYSVVTTSILITVKSGLFNVNH